MEKLVDATEEKAEPKALFFKSKVDTWMLPSA
jgi:hypothetical protein